MIIHDSPCNWCSSLGEINNADFYCVSMLQLCKLDTIWIFQKYGNRPYFATISHAVMVHQRSSHNDYSWFILSLMLLTWRKSIMLISIVFPCYNCASCMQFEFSKSTQLDPTLQLNHMLWWFISGHLTMIIHDSPCNWCSSLGEINNADCWGTAPFRRSPFQSHLLL